MRRVAFLLLCLAMLAGCASGPHGAATAARAVLVVNCEVPDAAVWIDDHLVGEVRELRRGVRLAPGEHRVELRHDSYHTRYVEVRLGPGESRTVDVKLAEVLD